MYICSNIENAGKNSELYVTELLLLRSNKNKKNAGCQCRGETGLRRATHRVRRKNIYCRILNFDGKLLNSLCASLCSTVTKRVYECVKRFSKFHRKIDRPLKTVVRGTWRKRMRYKSAANTINKITPPPSRRKKSRRVVF